MSKVLINFYISLLYYLLGIKSSYLLAFTKLVSISFDIKEQHRYKYKNIFSSFKKILKAPVLKHRQLEQVTFAIYDLSINSKELRSAYLNNLDTKYQHTEFIAGNDLIYFSTVLQKIIFIFCILPAQVLLCIYGFIKKDKSGISTIFINVLKTFNCVENLKKSNIKNSVLFSAYDTNSAFLAQNLIRENIYVSTVTSEVPIYKWNQIIITNELILCHEYQKNEVKYFHNTLIYDTLLLGKPEEFFCVENLYTQQQSKNLNIGFLSTGGWVRNKFGHINQGTNMEDNETKILISLNAILRKHYQLNLIIYPHPREFKYYNNSISELTKHYNVFLKDISFTINSNNTNSNKLFDDCYVALCFFTTLIFERSFAKRNSAIVYFKDNHFPLANKDSWLSIINTKEDLENYLILKYQL